MSGNFERSCAWLAVAARLIISITAIAANELRPIIALLRNGDAGRRRAQHRRAPRFSFPGLLEIAGIGRRLVLARGHQVAVRAEEIVVLADDHVVVVLAAIVLVPD